jgi:DNA primase
VPLLLAQLQPDQTAQFFFLPAKEDPDSWVRRIGRDAFLQQLDEQSLSIAQWLVAGLSENHLLDWQKADDSRRLLQLSLPYLQTCTQPALQYQLLQALANAAQLQEWQIEKLLGIKTGLAVHRKPSQHKLPTTQSSVSTTNTISQRLLTLLSHFPQLTCPLDSEAQTWLKQHPHKGSQSLWQQLHKPVALPDNTHNTPHLLSFEQAELEWNDGWQQWLCQALKPIRMQLLQRLTTTGLSNQEQQQLNRTKALLKQCKQS